MFRSIRRILILTFIAGVLIPETVTTAQTRMTRSQIDSLMKARWSFVTNRNYPRNADGVKRMIREYAPREFEAILAEANELRISESYSDARSWYDILLKDDPNHIEANYGMGITRRELGAMEATVARAASWKPAERNFQRVIAADSTYRDAYYQYAKLMRYSGEYKRAVELGQIQLRIRPTAEARVGIFRFYDYLIAHLELDDLELWLEWRDTWYDTYSVGELYRRHGQLEKAKHHLSRALNEPTQGASFIPAYLSLVRLYVEQEEPLLAHETYWNAVNDVKDAVDRQLLVNDMYTIMNENEFSVFERQLQPHVLTRAMELFWLRRDPMPADRYNHRLIEHYRRMIEAEAEYRYDGFRHWSYKDDRQNVLEFPPWYDLNHKFNDEGLIFIRYGKPDETSFALTKDDELVDQNDPLSSMRLDNSFAMDQVEGFAPKLPRSGLSISNMSWLYRASGSQPKRIFHFTVSENGPPGYWKLVPGFMEREILSHLVIWDTKYSRILNASGNEVLSLYNRMSQEMADMVMESFKSDRHTWPERTEILELSHLPVRFKESDDEAVLELSYAIPIVQLVEEGGSRGNRVEVGVAVYDERLREVYRDSRQFSLEGSQDPNVWGNYFIDEFQIPLPMDTYNVALHAKVPQTQHLGGTKFPFPMQDLSGEALMCSSLKLAFEINPDDESEERDRHHVRMVPNPTKRFRKTDPMFAYYEIYNLGYNRDGRTDFTVSFELKESGRNRNVFNRVAGLFRGSEDYKVSVSNTQSGTDRKVTDYISFDMSRLRQGSYELSLVVKDNVTGVETTTQAELELL